MATANSIEYVKVTEKEIAEAVKEDGYVLGTQEDDEGTEKVYRMSVSEIYETMTEKAETAATTVATEIVEENMTAVQEATDAANTAADNANDSASKADETVETVTSEWTELKETVNTEWAEIKESVSTEWETLKEDINADVDAAVKKAEDAASDAEQVASDVADAWNALSKSIADSVNTTLANVTDDYSEWKEQADSDLATAIANAEEATDNANSAADNANAAAENCDAVAAENLENALASLLATLDDTVDTYKDVMRKCYLLGSWDSVTAFCDWWYAVTRPSWTGGVEFYQPDVSAVSTGTKILDNADLTCTPSTDTVAGQDDYAGLPLFAPVDVNWEVDAETLQPVITAIDGITSNFKRSDPDVYVGVMQMSGWFCEIEASDTYTLIYSANRNIPYPVEPVPNAVNADGTFREWVLSAKYMSHTTDDSTMTSCSGLIPTTFISHNTLHTLSKNTGAQYSGTSVVDDTWLYIMFRLKYASLTADGILQGCVNMNYQYYARVAEEGVKRVILTTANAANLEVGMSVLIGYYDSTQSSPLDRGVSTVYATSGRAGCLITKIESVTIDDTEYSAVYVDLDDTFDTAANGSATDDTTIISTWHWTTGTTDCVLGNDGSPTSNTSGKYPCKLQGVEIMNGAYEIFADVILSLYQDENDETVYYYEPYVVMESANQSTAITSNYIATGLTCEQPSSDGWRYIKRREYAHGVYFVTQVGGTSSTYTRDGFYQNASVTGTREWLARGHLNNGVANGGLSYLRGSNSLSIAHWDYAARLSACGNRGEWVA